MMTCVPVCVQKRKRSLPARQTEQSPNEEIHEILHRGVVNVKLAAAEQQAKADAKKAKKQRQKAKKKLTQAEALAPHTSRAETTLLPQSAKPDSSELHSSSAPNDSASVGEAHAVGAATGVSAGVLGGITAEATVGVTAGVEEEEGASRKDEDAGMLEIFRCPLSKVSRACSSDGLLALLVSASCHASLSIPD